MTNIFKLQIKSVSKKEEEDDQKERKIKKNFLEMIFQISQILLSYSLIYFLISLFKK
jgi:hypothetical protein